MNWINGILKNAKSISQSTTQQWIFSIIVSILTAVCIVIYLNSMILMTVSILPLVIQLLFPNIIKETVRIWMIFGLIWSSIIGIIFIFMIYLFIGLPKSIFAKKKVKGWGIAEKENNLRNLF